MAMATRHEARERAVSLCYECEQRALPLAAVLESLPMPPDSFAVELARGVESCGDELDALLRRFSERWALGRMPVIDRCILRIGCYELLHCPDVPTAVVISEAVELAKQYSTKDSGRFVNGMLSRISDEVRAGV